MAPMSTQLGDLGAGLPALCAKEDVEMPQDQNPSIVKSRWVQLIVGIVGMVAIANLQYGWTLFVGPINQKFGWGTPAIQVAFTLFVLAETWLVPFVAYFV